MATVPRSRSARALANDQVIRDAGVEEILRSGVDRVSLRDVGQRAGFTHGATYARYEDVDELLVDLWITDLRVRLASLFDLCRDAAEHPGSMSVEALVEFARSATPADVAAIMLLFSARRFPALFEEVEPFIVEYFANDGDTDPYADPIMTRALGVFALITTLIGNDFHFDSHPNDFAVLEAVLFDMFASPANDDDVIVLDEPSLDTLPEPEDNLRAQLGHASLLVVSKSGYTHATISRIARRAGCSPGLVYRLFASKEDLVVAAFRASLRARWMRIDSFIHVLERGHLAQSLYNTTAPINAVRRDFVLEFSLAAANVPKLHDTLASQSDDLVAILPLLASRTSEEIDELAAAIRFISYLTTGTTFLSASCGVLHCANTSQLTEPFRRSILKRVGPQWADLCAILSELRDL